MLAHPHTMALFSAWANRRVLDACQGLEPGEVERDRGAFFGSILGTLNHILLVDLLYRERIEAVPTRFKSLDEILHTSLVELGDAQAQSDAYSAGLLDGMTEAQLDEPMGFYTLLDDPEYWEVAKRVYYTNLFQHQVHHRGHVHNMLSQAGIDPPPIGFIEHQVELGNHVIHPKS
jgi:uncharacterized damage-inducible protein DinB